MTPNELRSVSGYTGVMIAPIEDGDVSAADLRHVLWLFAQCFPTAVEVFGFALEVAPDIGIDTEISRALGFTLEII